MLGVGLPVDAGHDHEVVAVRVCVNVVAGPPLYTWPAGQEARCDCVTLVGAGATHLGAHVLLTTVVLVVVHGPSTGEPNSFGQDQTASWW